MASNSEHRRKILHLIWTFGHGGIQVMITDLANQQVRDHHVHLVIINRDPLDKLLSMLDRRVKVHRLERTRGSFTPLKYLWLNLLVHSIRPHVIHCHIPNQARLLFGLRRRKLHLTLHDVNKDLKDVHRYHRIYSISRSVQQDLLERAGIESRVIYNGIALHEIRVKKRGYREEQEDREEAFRIVVLGRLMHEKKGQDLFIRALAHLIRKQGVNGLQATVIGDGKSRHYLENLAKDLEISEHIDFTGARNRDFIQEHLCDFDLLVQPSRYEGFGITVIEGMAAGIPVLVSDIDGPMEIIREGKYGSYFKSGEAIDCAQKILEIKEKAGNDEFRARVEKARVYVNQNFSIESTSRNYCKSYFEP